MDIRDFLCNWYRRRITAGQIPEVYSAWLQTNWGCLLPSLVFAEAQIPGIGARKTVEITDIVNNGKSVVLRYEVEDNITDPWYEEVSASQVPQIVGNFLRIDNPQEEQIYVDLGPHIRWWERLYR